MDEKDEEVFYQITGKGLHAIGAIDDSALHHFQRVEEERENWLEIANAANEACQLMYNALNAVYALVDDEQVRGIIEDVLSRVTREEGDNE